jgi:hypothetical protein
MPSDQSDLSTAAAELALLRALIAPAEATPAGQLPAKLVWALDKLSNHRWLDEEHRVVYHSLRAALRSTAVPLRQQMAVEATRMGHPDVDWPLYFPVSAL